VCNLYVVLVEYLLLVQILVWHHVMSKILLLMGCALSTKNVRNYKNVRMHGFLSEMKVKCEHNEAENYFTPSLCQVAKSSFLHSNILGLDVSPITVFKSVIQ